MSSLHVSTLVAVVSTLSCEGIAAVAAGARPDRRRELPFKSLCCCLASSSSIVMMCQVRVVEMMPLSDEQKPGQF